MKENIKKLLEGKWSDKYFCKLAVLDHLRECLEKDNYLKATDEPKTSVGYKNLNKELMDLKILLDMYFNEDDKLCQARIKKFVGNMENKGSRNRE